MQGQVFNLGEVYRQGEAIKGAQMDNQLRRDALDLKEVFSSTARAAIDPETGSYDAAAHARGLVKAGRPEVAQRLLGEHLQHLTALNQYVDSQIPRMNAVTYASIRADMIDKGLVRPEQLPEQYDREFVEREVQRIRGLTREAFTTFQNLGQVGDTTLVGQVDVTTGKAANVKTITPRQDGGEPLETVIGPDGQPVLTPRSQAAGMRPGKASDGQPGTADEALIFRMTGQLFGGTYDPVSGQFTGLDPANATRAQQVTAVAVDLYKQGQGQLSRADAVEEARKLVKMREQNRQEGVQNRPPLEQALPPFMQPGP